MAISIHKNFYFPFSVLNRGKFRYFYASTAPPISSIVNRLRLYLSIPPSYIMGVIIGKQNRLLQQETCKLHMQMMMIEGLPFPLTRLIKVNFKIAKLIFIFNNSADLWSLFLLEIIEEGGWKLSMRNC